MCISLFIGLSYCQDDGNVENIPADDSDTESRGLMSFLFPTTTTKYYKEPNKDPKKEPYKEPYKEPTYYKPTYEPQYEYMTTKRPLPITNLTTIKLRPTLTTTLPPTIFKVHVTVPPAKKEQYEIGKETDYYGIPPRPAPPVKVIVSHTTTTPQPEYNE